MKPSDSSLRARTTAAVRAILLLDSDPVMRAALRDALQSAGHVVEVAGDLGTAVERLDEESYDLLITRPYINSMPGAVAADYLRSRYHGLPVLVIAGFLDDDRVSVQKTIEDIYVFPQPFSRDQLLAKVRDVLHVIRTKTRAS